MMGARALSLCCVHVPIASPRCLKGHQQTSARNQPAKFGKETAKLPLEAFQ